MLANDDTSVDATVVYGEEFVSAMAGILELPPWGTQLLSLTATI